MPPRRAFLRIGAVATAVVIAGVAISRVDLQSSGENSSSGAPAPTAIEDAGGGGETPQVNSQPDSVPLPGSGAEDEYELAPNVAQPAASSAERATGIAADVGALEESPVAKAKPKIAQKVDLSLATAPPDFRDAADGVFDVVATHDGFVLESSISGGDPAVKGSQPGQASFKLKIPAGELQAALAELSDLGHVVARTDGTEDISERFIGAKRRIAQYTEARQNLLEQLEDAVTPTEQQSIRARLRIVEAQLRDAEGDLGSARQRVHLVPVSVSLASDETIVKDGGDSDESGWGIGDALRDARDVLRVMAGIALVSLAVLVPLSLVGLLLWWAAARIQRQRREAALDT
jgi:hypothetical protein